MEKVIDVPLNAPLNLSFVDKKDEKGRFMYNNGILSEAGLHNAFEERGKGTWLGEFDKDEIYSILPPGMVLEFSKRFNARIGRPAWLTPALTATWPSVAGDPVRLSDGREVEVPVDLQRLRWRASSGPGNQYMCAVRWGGERLHIHIFHVDSAGAPVFSTVNVNVSTCLNTLTAPVASLRMAAGEMGDIELADYLSMQGALECHPVVIGRIAPEETGEQVGVGFYGASAGDFSGIPNVGATVSGAPFGEGLWRVFHVSEPVFREDPPRLLPNPGFDPRERIDNPRHNPERLIPNPDFDSADPDSPEYIDNPDYNPDITVPNPNHDPREKIDNPNFDPERKYERTVWAERFVEQSLDAERFLHVGIDVGAFSLNSCAVVRINPDDTFALTRMIKGFWAPALDGSVRGFPFPENHVTTERGYSPVLRDATGSHLRLDPEIIRADSHRGVAYVNGHLQHLPDGARGGADLPSTQTFARLVSAWNADFLEFMPAGTSQNFNGEYYETDALEGTFHRRSGLTAFFHGFALDRQSLRLTIDGDDRHIPNFGGFYCVPRRSPNARFAPYGIAQYSMFGVFEARHIGIGDSTDPFRSLGNFQDIQPQTFRQGARFSLRRYHPTRTQGGQEWWIEQDSLVVRRTDAGGHGARNSYYEAVNPGTATIVQRGRHRHGLTDWRTHVRRLSVTVAPSSDARIDTGEARLAHDCGRMVLGYPAKEASTLRTSPRRLESWSPPRSGELHQGAFALSADDSVDSAFANVLYGGNVVIPARAETANSEELKQSPQALGIFDAHVFGADGIDVYITTAAGEPLWTSINDAKVATGAPSQIITHGDAVLLVFDEFTVYAHATNRNGSMVPAIRLLTPKIAAVSQTGFNMVEKRGEREMQAHHAFSGLGYRTNVIGGNVSPGTEEVQSNFQDILIDNKHGNVPPPNSLTLAANFLVFSPEYPQPFQHVNVNTPPSDIRENIHAFRYAFPVSVERGPALDEWLRVKGNNVQAHVINGEMTLTSDIVGARGRLQQIVIHGQLFEFDESFITPVNFEGGGRVFGQHTNIFNKVFAGASSQRAYFFDFVTKSIDSFQLDSGFEVGTPLDLVDRVLGAVPLNEFSYTDVLRLDNEKGGAKRQLLHMANSGVFFRDFGDIVRR